MNLQEEIKKTLNERISTGTSQNQLSKELGISAGTISQICNGKWEDISKKMWNRLAAKLKLDNWQLIETSNFLTIQKLCADAQEYSRFFAISQKSGYGKTAGLQYYRNKGTNAFYMMADILMISRRNFIMALQDSMGMNTGATTNEKFTAVVEKLNSLECPLVIIDDVGKLNDDILRMLQLLYDRTERRCGIVVAGTDFFKIYLERGMQYKKMGFEELYRRVELWQPLSEPSLADVESMAKANGFADMVMIRAIYRLAKNYGSIRAMITNAIRLKERDELSIENLTGKEKIEA